jgi:hypothetical protein
MSKDYEKTLVDLTHKKLGPSPTVEQVVRYLVRGRAIGFKQARAHVIREEFFAELMRSGRMAKDVEDEIAEQHNVHPSWVRFLRSQQVLEKLA